MATDDQTPVPAGTPGSLIGDLAGFGAVGAKLLDMISGATGAVARPWVARRDGTAALDVETAGIVRRAEAEARAAMIAAEGQMDIAERAARRLRSSEIRKQENLERIVGHALERIGDMTGAEKAAAREIEEDWLQAFIEYAGKVSDHSLREVWAQILANQGCEKRARVSFATIDSLRLLEPHLARALLRALQAWLVFGQCLDVVEAAPDETGSLRLYDLHYHALCGIGLLELRSSQQTSLTFKEFVWSFHDDDGGFAPIHVDTLWPAWRGLELGDVLFPEFYRISMGELPVSEDVCGEFAARERQTAILNEWAASLAVRCGELRLSVLLEDRTDEHRRGRAGSRTVPTHRWTDAGWERLADVAPEVLARVPRSILRAEANRRASA